MGKALRTLQGLSHTGYFLYRHTCARCGPDRKGKTSVPKGPLRDCQATLCQAFHLPFKKQPGSREKKLLQCLEGFVKCQSFFHSNNNQEPSSRHHVIEVWQPWSPALQPLTTHQRNVVKSTDYSCSKLVMCIGPVCPLTGYRLLLLPKRRKEVDGSHTLHIHHQDKGTGKLFSLKGESKLLKVCGI